MYRHLIYILAIWGCLALSACGSDDAADKDTGMVNIVFTVSVPAAEQGTSGRAVSRAEDYVGNMETAIDPSRLHIVMYSSEGVNLSAIEDMSILRGEDKSVYTVVGSIPAAKLQLQNGRFEGKLMVYANMDGVSESANFTSDAISGLSYSYPDAKGYIPMWGVKKINAAFYPGKRTTLDGTIGLLRAEAKIYVFLSQDMIDNNYELTEATLHGYNTKGYGLPQLQNYRDAEDANLLTMATSSHFYPSPSATPELDMLGKSIYVPEYQNVGEGITPAYITVSVRDKDRNETKQYTVRFENYENGVSTKEPFDIVRNHYYRYELYQSSAGKIDVNLTVRKWAQVTHSDILI